MLRGIAPIASALVGAMLAAAIPGDRSRRARNAGRRRG